MRIFPIYWLLNRDLDEILTMVYHNPYSYVYTWIVKSPTYPKQPRFFVHCSTEALASAPHPSTINLQVLRSLRSPTGAELCRGIGLVFQDFWLIVTSARMDGPCSEKEKIVGSLGHKLG